MKEDELRRRVILRAESLLGCREADGSHRPIVAAYNAIRPLPQGYRLREDDPWCAAFVSAVGQMEGLTDVLLPECGCDRMIALYRRAGRWRTGDGGAVRPGDLIFYNWDGNGSADHVGLIRAVNAGDYEVIEGNLSDAVGCRRAPKDWSLIAGFALPDYAAAGDEETPADEAVRLPCLRRGDRGGSVRAMQGILIALGFGCGPDGADGDLGANTEAALRRFQRDAGLPADGLCGAESWRKLLGVSG